jgi:hypothetical protein
MPRYFFDTDDGQHLIKDDEGLDLYSLHEARLQAQAALADMAPAIRCRAMALAEP